MPPNGFDTKNIDNKNPPLYARLTYSTASRAISAVVFAVVIPVGIVAVLRALHTLQAAHTADMFHPPAVNIGHVLSAAKSPHLRPFITTTTSPNVEYPGIRLEK